MSVDPIEIPGEGEGGGLGGGGWGGDYPDALPGLQVYLRPRYTFNCVVSEQVSAWEFLTDVVFPTSAMFLTQGSNGKVRMHNKKPVDHGFALDELTAGQTVLDIDDVSPWIGDLSGYLLIDPHTTQSEARTVLSANYVTAQNAVTLTTDTPADIDITGFSGCDGDATPATATIEILDFTADQPYEVVLDGITFAFTPSAGDTLETIASFLAGAMRKHPKVFRRFYADHVDGDAFLTITARFGELEIDDPLEFTHEGPIADPTEHPVTNAIDPGSLFSGPYRLAYAFRNHRGQTNLSPYWEATIADHIDIEVEAITPPSGCTVVHYISVESYTGNTKVRKSLENDGSTFIYSSLPKRDDPLPPDFNRTGAEVMRVRAVFTDRRLPRSSALRSNVLMASFKWSLADRRRTINRVDIKYHDASQDWRSIELRISDKAHIAKIRKAVNEQVNGQGIDNYFQAFRRGAQILQEARDADFFYSWTATRRALLLEEGDVVAITDSSTGVVNFPVMIQDIDLEPGRAGMPRVNFTASKFANSLYDDNPAEIAIPIAVG